MKNDSRKIRLVEVENEPNKKSPDENQFYFINIKKRKVQKLPLKCMSSSQPYPYGVISPCQEGPKARVFFMGEWVVEWNVEWVGGW